MARCDVQDSTRPGRRAGTCSCRRRRSRRRARRRRPGTRRANGRRRAARARRPRARARRSPAAPAATCPVWNITCETTTRSVPRQSPRRTSCGGERAVVTRLDQRERDPAAPRVLAQDHVERIEFAARRDDARRRVVRVQHGAQSLPGAGLRHDAIGTRRAEERARAARGTRPSRRPTRPTHRPCRAYHAASPSRTSSSRRVERPAERVVREVDAAALRGEHAREERRDVHAHAVFGQRSRAERRRPPPRCDVAAHRA